MKKWIFALFLAFSTAYAGILPQPTATNFTLYLSPTGSDSNSGYYSSTPLQTLAAAQKVLKLINPFQNVVIYVAPGTYTGQRVVWDFVRPDYLLTIKGTGSTKPVFDGGTGEGTWFVLKGATGQPTNIVLDNLQVQHYWMAVSLNGNYLYPNNYNWNNTISNNIFQDIGNGFNPNLPYSYAAVRLYNSRNNKVVGNTFKNIINNGAYDGYIHAIYLASYSSSNTISNNRFENVSGDPIRIRDTSNWNYITNNTFLSTGKYAVNSDWYCYGTGCDKVECPSWETNVNQNTYGLDYDSVQKLPVTAYSDSRLQTGCGKPSSTSTRFVTSSNLFLVQ